MCYFLIQPRLAPRALGVRNRPAGEVGSRNSEFRIQKSEVRIKQPLGGGILSGCRPRASHDGQTDNGPLTFSAAPPPRAWISRYAWGNDYHEIVRARLKQLLRARAVTSCRGAPHPRVLVDTVPTITGRLLLFFDRLDGKEYLPH